MGPNYTPPLRGDSSLIKNLNRSVVLELLREQGPLSRSEIAKRANISPSAVSKIVNQLIGENRVVEVGKAESSGGRKRILLGYNFSFGKVIGVDIGATKTAMAITDLSGQILAKRRLRTRELAARGGIVAGTAHEIRRLIEQLAIEPGELVGVGVGLPAIVRDGVIVTAPGLSLAEQERAFATLLSSQLDLPVWVDNDTNATALGEYWKGSLQGVTNGLCVAIGTGIGMGMLLNGELYRGSNGAAGEIGYWLFENLDSERADNQYGFLERFAAGPGIERRMRQAFKDQALTVEAFEDQAFKNDEFRAARVTTRADRLGTTGRGGALKAVSATEVFALADRGHPAAVKVVKETTDMLAVALSNVASLLDPEVIVITGGVSGAGHSLLDPIVRTVERVVPYPPQVHLSTLREEAAILGAVWGVLRQNGSAIRIHMAPMA